MELILTDDCLVTFDTSAVSITLSTITAVTLLLHDW